MSITHFLRTALAAALLAAIAMLVWEHHTNRELAQEVAELRREVAENGQKLRAKEPVSSRASRQNSPAPKAVFVATGSSDGGRDERRADVAPSDAPLLPALRPLNSLHNAGNKTAKDSIETLYWAIFGGDADEIRRMLEFPPGDMGVIAKKFSRLPPDLQAKFGSPEQMFATEIAGSSLIEGIRIMGTNPGASWQGSDPALRNDPAYETVYLQRQNRNGDVSNQTLVLHRTPGGWRWFFPAPPAPKPNG